MVCTSAPHLCFLPANLSASAMSTRLDCSQLTCKNVLSYKCGKKRKYWCWILQFLRLIYLTLTTSSLTALLFKLYFLAYQNHNTKHVGILLDIESDLCLLSGSSFFGMFRWLALYCSGTSFSSVVTLLTDVTEGARKVTRIFQVLSRD